MIVKVQRALVSTDGVDRVLIYNRNRSVQFESVVDESIVDAMRGTLKAFFNANVADDGSLELRERVKDQPW